MSRKVEIKVLEIEKYYGEWFPKTLTETIEWLQEKLSSIPEEYRADATIDVSASVHEDDSVALEISYWRPETEEEAANREV